ncbi:MAG: hypothetical protein B6247_15385 [Candidatus Parabeggiatoa sp. nov. 2]|nr:MAG: hypothetical protein B6247_15385 [Beggiatoa sp. 4572_84]
MGLNPIFPSPKSDLFEIGEISLTFTFFNEVESMKMKHRHFAKVVLLCVPLVSVAKNQPCLDSSLYETTQIRVGGLKTPAPVLYFLNRSPVPTYSNDTTEQVAELSKKPLGSPFFGIKGHKTEQRVKIGRYDHKQDCFTEVLGWVKKPHLLHSNKPLRVGDVVKRFPRLKDQTPSGQAATTGQSKAAQQRSKGQTPSGQAATTDQSKAAQQQMSETNRLFLRALSRPEHGTKPATAPGQKQQQASASEIKIGHLGHLWRYVYAVEEINQQLWYLVGSKSQLMDRAYIPKIDDTITKEVRQGLLGWIPQRQVSEWSSNVVLEPNTDKKAVKERYDTARMATLYKEADENSPILAQENKELWKSAIDGKVNDTTQARFAPLGLAPEIARYFVKGYNKKTGWYHVASVGASKENPLTEAEIRAFLSKLRKLTNQLRAVDVVFVVDHSGSMGNEIESVKEFFNKFSRQLGKAHRKGGAMRLNLPGGKLASIETNLDIKVSFVLYERQPVDITAQPRRLPDEQAVLDKEVKNTRIWGGTEDVHHALYSVINNAKYWRPYAHRAIIVITDEPGDPVSHNEQHVLQSLKQALQAPRATIKKLGGNPAQIDYRDYTQIWAIFADTHSPFNVFKGNMDSLTHSDRIIHIKDFVGDLQQRNKLLARFNETIYGLQQSVTDRLNQLAVQIKKDTQSKSSTAASSQTSPQTTTKHKSILLLHQAAIDAAKQQLGINDKVFAALGALAFVEGHTPKRMPGSQNDTYREVALIERRDLRALYDQAESFLQAFDQSLKKGKGNPRAMVAVALLQAIAELSGNDNLLDDIEEMSMAKLRRYARRWLNQRKVKDNSLAELIGLQDSLPIPSEGLFGMTPKDIQRLPPDKILVERDMLALKQICLKKILGGETVPQNVNDCRVYQGPKKDWNYQPAGSSNTYIYLPLHLVP